ncbi:hypothetical protein BDP27DRAFT_1361240 [Rhodocollybia butyracea]|uniref:Uncharacterized protein n=1 Tax=Rhodocollybia butyracea TaxID=206335 RepID=A0A9P5PZC8_9AGAR|nr:hypothetical protein BDP27DRAFT_1361240 [Rhodocollybia butyracea]
MSMQGGNEVGEWMQHHHSVQPGRNGQEIHVFTIGVEDVFGGSSSKKSWTISVPLGFVVFTFEVSIDIATGSFSVCAYVKVPLYPQIELGCVTGSLIGGASMSFEGGITSGSLRFYMKDKWLGLEYDVNVLGMPYAGDVKLIPIP